MKNCVFRILTSSSIQLWTTEVSELFITNFEDTLSRINSTNLQLSPVLCQGQQYHECEVTPFVCYFSLCLFVWHLILTSFNHNTSFSYTFPIHSQQEKVPHQSLERESINSPELISLMGSLRARSVSCHVSDPFSPAEVHESVVVSTDLPRLRPDPLLWFLYTFLWLFQRVGVQDIGWETRTRLRTSDLKFGSERPCLREPRDDRGRQECLWGLGAVC